MRPTKLFGISQKRSATLSFAVLIALLVGCDKKATMPDHPVATNMGVSSSYDVPPPPPVVKMPDTGLGSEDVVELEDAGPVEHGDAPQVDLQAVVAAQAAFVEAKAEKLDKVQAQVKEAKRLIKAKGGKKGLESWKKRHGAKVPTMAPLHDLEQMSPKWKNREGGAKQVVLPRFILGEGRE